MIFVEIWWCNNEIVFKLIMMEKELVLIVFDLYLQMVDVDFENNYFLC